MRLRIELSPAAQIEFDEAADWYGAKSAELRERFVTTIDATLARIQRSPTAFPITHGTHVRRNVLRKFPYIILFTVEADRILVYSVFHTSRNPIVWRGRVG
jgi:plasmid stabilization system protein ParE